MSDVRVSVGGHNRSLPAGRVLVLGVAAALALIVLAGLVGRWSASGPAAPVKRESIPAHATVPDQPGPGRLGAGLGGVGGLGSVGGLGAGLGGGSLCLLARPC